ncbi:hypothetical protein ACRRVD_01675 [Candidatus Cardinium hertigii]|uniref:hypothetical protein n=1 Tax=Candidatus Cardinium hertigii TaxID=247481 RepID=UPI003D7DE7EF
MAYKFNTLKSIKQALIAPNILFPAAYLLFSAEVCTRTPKYQPIRNSANASLLPLTAKPVVQLNAIEGLETSTGNGDRLEAAKPVSHLDEIESLEPSTGNTDELEAVKPVADLNPDVVPSVGNGDGLEAVNPVVQPEVEESLSGSEANTDGLKADRANLACQTRTDGHKPERDSDCNQVSQCAGPLSQNRSLAPSTKPKKNRFFNKDPEVKIFEVEEEIEESQEETATEQKLVQPLVEAERPSSNRSENKKPFYKNIIKNVKKPFKNILLKNKQGSPKGQSSVHSDIPVDHLSENRRDSNQMSQSPELFSQHKEDDRVDRSFTPSTKPKKKVFFNEDPEVKIFEVEEKIEEWQEETATEQKLVQPLVEAAKASSAQPIGDDATKEAQENSKGFQELDEALIFLRSLVDDRSVDQSMEHDTTKDDQEQKLKQDMENMLNDCTIYLEQN